MTTAPSIPDELVAERLAKAFAPALFADALEAWSAAELLVRDLPTAHPRRAEVIWRALELRTSFDPIGVVTQLEHAPPPPDGTDRPIRVPIAALLACGHLDRAAAALAGVTATTAAIAVLRGQHALATGAAATAETWLAQARVGAVTVEDRAAAWLWSMEAAAALHDRAAVAAHAEALGRLLGQHGGLLSQPMVELQAALHLTGDRAAFVALVFGRHADEATARLGASVLEDPATLGPIPRHVHGAFRTLRGDPVALEGALLNVVGLELRADRADAAYATMVFAARLAPRLLPPAAAARWQEAVTQLRVILGAERVAGFDVALAAQEAAFLQARRPP